MKVKHVTCPKGLEWAVADGIFPTDYAYDPIRSERAGYPVYHSTAHGVNAYICDLGTRLELNMPDGSTIDVWTTEAA